MASDRVAHLLDEIARLSREEQTELMRDHPRVLLRSRSGGSRGGPSGERLVTTIVGRDPRAR